MIPDPLMLSQAALNLMGVKLAAKGQYHLPIGAPMIVVSNHRSPLDACIVMAGLGYTVEFACHPYMNNVPVLKDFVTQFGGFPISGPRQFFGQGYQRLRQRRAVGVFPEGAKPMVTLQPPRFINPFHRGFAHLALRAPVSSLAVLPVAIVSDDEGIESPVPLRLLSWFDPSEPLFQKAGGHPVVMYRRVELRVGPPLWITQRDRDQYQGQQGSNQAQQLTDTCWETVRDLLKG